MKSLLRRPLLAVVLLSLLPVFLYSQNKVITHDIRWRLSAIPHFDLYHYDTGGTVLEPVVSRYLEDAWQRSTIILSTQPAQIYPFFLYNNHNDFEGSNIVDITDNTGGVTEAFKDRFLIAQTGSQRTLQHVIAHEFTHELEFEYLYTGFWKSFRLLKTVLYPSWLMEGLAEYTSGDLDWVLREMIVRDAATSGGLLSLDDLHNFNHLLPHQVTLAYKESELLMRYIAREYGQEKFAVILTLFHDAYAVDPVLKNAIGIGLNTLDWRFRESLEDYYKTQSAQLFEPEHFGRRLTNDGPYPRFYSGPVYSGDGAHIAWLGDDNGAQELYLADGDGRNARRLWRQSGAIKEEAIYTEGSCVRFSPDNTTLAFAGKYAQRDKIYLYSINSGGLRSFRPGTDSVTDLCYSRDGEKIYFSGLADGMRDLYGYSLKDGSLRKLTNGYMDKTNCALSPDGSTLVFAAERLNARGRIEYDLCALNLGTLERRWLTAMPGDETQPCYFPDGKHLAFISDQDGVKDMYTIDLSNGETQRLTKVIGGCFSPKVSPDGKKVLFTSYRRGQRHVYEMLLAEQPPMPAGAVVAFDVARASTTVPAFVAAQAAKPYKTKASLDLFFPFAFYSSVDGFIAATYAQGSDYLGNHQAAGLVSYTSAADSLNYDLTYSYLRWRPKVYFTFNGKAYYDDQALSHRISEDRQGLQVNYPLNREQSVLTGASTIDRRDTYSHTPALNAHSRENNVTLGFSHSNVEGPYLEITSGFQALILGQYSGHAVSSDLEYQNYSAQLTGYIPAGWGSVVMANLFTGENFGRNAGTFRLGGVDRIRGLSDKVADTGVAVANVELRFPLSYNLNYHAWYIFPDLYCKSLYGVVLPTVDAAGRITPDCPALVLPTRMPVTA